MRICFASTLYPGLHDRWGGAEVACQRLRDLLEKNGHRVAVVTTRPDRSSSNGLEHYSVPTWADHLGRTGAMALDTLVPFDPLAFSPMGRLLDRIRPDVMHLHSFKELTFSVLSAARKRRIPVLFSLYDLWALCPQSNLVHYRGGTCRSQMGFGCLVCAVPMRKPLVLFRRAFFKHFLPQIDCFIVLSETARQQLALFGLPEKKISILPLPLFEGLGRPAPGNLDERSILFAGWMIRPKGLQVLIEAMPRVLARVPGAKVLVVETGAHAGHKAEFQRRIAELGLANAFQFLGKRSAAEIQALLARASVVAVPEQWGIAWPIFCTEAMSYAKPIAASRIGDIPHFIRDGETGRLFDPQSPEQLAECLVSFFADPAAALRLGRRAQDFILEECDPSRITAALLSHYQEVRS
jgi:glycosyltransferase involved in cell wall biosynthesis